MSETCGDIASNWPATRPCRRVTCQAISSASCATSTAILRGRRLGRAGPRARQERSSRAHCHQFASWTRKSTRRKGQRLARLQAEPSSASHSSRCSRSRPGIGWVAACRVAAADSSSRSRPLNSCTRSRQGLPVHGGAGDVPGTWRVDGSETRRDIATVPENSRALSVALRQHSPGSFAENTGKTGA